MLCISGYELLFEVSSTVFHLILVTGKMKESLGQYYILHFYVGIEDPEKLDIHCIC